MDSITVLFLACHHSSAKKGYCQILWNLIVRNSSCLCPLLAISVLYFEKKIGISCVNIRKIFNSTHTKHIPNFDNYFLFTYLLFEYFYQVRICVWFFKDNLLNILAFFLCILISSNCKLLTGKNTQKVNKENN